jgi:hypothetical protein
MSTDYLDPWVELGGISPDRRGAKHIVEFHLKDGLTKPALDNSRFEARVHAQVELDFRSEVEHLFDPKHGGPCKVRKLG